MRILYDIVFLLFAIASLPILALKGKFHRGFVQKFGFALPELPGDRPTIWIHAVSVGEAALALRLAGELRRRRKVNIAISTTTVTGMTLIEKTPPGTVQAAFYYPFDISVVVRRAAMRIDPDVYVMMETELWPNLLLALESRRTAVMLANGRISDGSFENYRKVRFFTKRLMRCIDCLCVQTERDAERVKELGAFPEAVRIAGNMKFDEPLRPREDAPRRSRYFGREDCRVIVAGSTHFPEESILLDAFSKISERGFPVRMVLAPRHIERAEALRVQLRKRSIKWKDLSALLEGESAEEGTRLVLVDTIGHLKELYGLADVVFIGGSFSDRGGQNPIEAAAWGKPVIFGPNMSNFKEVAKRFIESGAARQIGTGEALFDTLDELLENARERDTMGRKAIELLKMNQGALKRTVSEIERFLKSSGSGT